MVLQILPITGRAGPLTSKRLKWLAIADSVLLTCPSRVRARQLGLWDDAAARVRGGCVRLCAGAVGAQRRPQTTFLSLSLSSRRSLPGSAAAAGKCEARIVRRPKLPPRPTTASIGCIPFHVAVNPSLSVLACPSLPNGGVSGGCARERTEYRGGFYD